MERCNSGEGESSTKARRKENHHGNHPLLVVRAFLLITFIHSYLYLLYGREPGDRVPIPRNAAWNDLVIQIHPTADDSPKETLGKEIVVMQKFLREHPSEVTVGIHDITVFRAIDQARARLRKADKDLETISNHLFYRKTKGSSVGDPWNAKQSSSAVNVTMPSSPAKALSASSFQGWKPTSSSITDCA